MEEIKNEIKKCNAQKQMKMKHVNYKPMGLSKSSAKRFTAIKARHGKKEKHLTNNPYCAPKTNRKRRTNKQKTPVSRRKEIIKIREEIIHKEMKQSIAKLNKTKSCFFEKINKIDKPLARLIKKEREKNQIYKIRKDNGEITTDNTEIQKIMRLL